MGARRSMPSSARERYFKRRIKRMGVLLISALVLAAVICGGLVYPVLAPDTGDGIGFLITNTPVPNIAAEVVQEVTATAVPIDVIEEIPLLPVPTEGQIIPPSGDAKILYYTIAGDSLRVVSLRFGVDMNKITSPDPLDREGLLPPGQLLVIPNNLTDTVTSSAKRLLPDSEVTYSPSTIDFDIHGFVDSAGGYLSTYSEYMLSTGWTSGADIIQRIALEYSFNPRLLLAALEQQSGWVYGFPDPDDSAALEYPLGYKNSAKRNLYRQSAWFASTVMDGYYGWREGRRLVINFQNGEVLRLAPELNAGTVGLMNVFTYLYDLQDWAIFLYGEGNFFTLFGGMMGDPWLRAQEVEPLIPVDTVQPEMILPFEVNKVWAFTGGPHAAWSAADVWAALDFAPPSAEGGCEISNDWVVASMPGRIIRSDNGVVVIDMDDDGYEQTGWTLLYLHIAEKGRIERGTWVEQGDPIGHPSCEGGRSTGTHVHMARRYNGEWVPADGPLPFTLSGWKARAWLNAYQGWLIRDSDIIYANTSSPSESHISREE